MRYCSAVGFGLATVKPERIVKLRDLRAALADLPAELAPFRYQARLNAQGIFTPLEFYTAPLPLLKNQVFKSITGYYWYLRLRGGEIDAVDFKRRSFGNTDKKRVWAPLPRP